MPRMHARARAGEGRTRVPKGVSLGSKRLSLVPLSACARVCRLHGHWAPSPQAFVVASASSAASGALETAFSVSLLARSLDPKRRPAGQTGVFKLLQTTLYFDLHRSNACLLLHNTISEDPEQIAVFNSLVLQQ